MKLKFGFDLGTTNSAISIIHSGLPKVLNTSDGLITPSLVGLDKDDNFVIGKKAIEAEKGYLNSFKKHMGSNKKLYIQDKSFTAKMLSNILVKGMIKDVKERYPEYRDIDEVIVSHPAYFDTNQIADTKRAFEGTGLKVVAVQSEPVSASITYQKTNKITQNILIYDLGGGTFDAVLMSSVPEFSEQTKHIYRYLLPNTELPERSLEIINTKGDNFLGGDNIDELVAEKFIEKYGEVEDKQALIRQCKYVKDNSCDSQFNSKNISYEDDVLPAMNEIYDRADKIVKDLLDSSNIKEEPIVILCGGSTKSTVLKERLQKQFSSVNWAIDPDKSVAIGNSIAGEFLDSNKLKLIQRAPKYICMKTVNGYETLIKKGDQYPTSVSLRIANNEPFTEIGNLIIAQSDDQKTFRNVSTFYLESDEPFDDEGQKIYNFKLVLNNSNFLTAHIVLGSFKKEIDITNISEDSDQEVDKPLSNIMKMLNEKKEIKEVKDLINKVNNKELTERVAYRLFRKLGV